VIFLFATGSQSVPRSTQPPNQWVPGVSFPVGKAIGTWS